MIARVALGALLCGLLATRPANAFIQLDLHAKRINFYVERLAVIADGNVHLVYPGGPEVQADSVYIDLRTERYVWAGHVRAIFGEAGRQSEVEATSLTIDRDGRAAYALIAGEGLPRVERIDRDDPADRTAVAPPDGTFVFPALREFRPYIYSSHVTIVPKTNIRFTPAFFPTSSGIVVPSPSYLYSYVFNPNFGASALAGANFDQPYGLFGTERSLTSAHFRYDSSLGTGLAVTQQFVYGDRAYIALGAGPLRKAASSAGLIAYQRLDPLRSQQLTASTTNGLQQVQYRFIQGTHHGAFNFILGQVNTQQMGDLTWSSDPYPISRSGFSYRLRADYGFDRNTSIGLLPPGADSVFYPMIWRTTLGTFLASPTFWGPLGTRMNVTLDASRIWYAYPHQRNAVTLGSTISRRISKQINLIGHIADSFAGDAYPGKQQIFYKPPSTPIVTPDGTVWPGYAAYAGFSSQRTYSLDAYYTTIPPFIDLRLNFTYARDFPQFAGFGRPPYSAAFDLRYRPGGTLVIELGRGYTFNWARMGWSPQWTFTIAQ